MTIQPPFVAGDWPRRLARLFCISLAGAVLTGAMLAAAQPVATAVMPGLQWTNGPWADPHFFPIAVWLQDPAHAEQYRQAGINTYVGLWEGPTEDQLASLKKAGLWVVCGQNETGRQHRNDPTIIGWMQGDEPDNDQSWGARFGFGSPVPPKQVVADYQQMKAVDSTRPILLNLGQGAAWDGWYGRGNRNQHPEDYPEYLKGCDIASFDIYPANHEEREVHGNLWYVAHGVDRLTQWVQHEKPVWNCIECTAIDNPRHKPTPEQVRAEVWMSLIHGSRGLIYFVHQFKPTSDNAALLADPAMLAAVTRINQQIARLAPVLNTPSLRRALTVGWNNLKVPLATTVKQSGGFRYLFAVATCPGNTEGTFGLEGVKGESRVEVLGENRTLMATNGVFRDQFDSWAVHLYKLELPAPDRP